MKDHGDEKKVTGLLEKILLSIDQKKRGTIIGTEHTVNYEKLLHLATFPNKTNSEDEVIRSLSSLYEGVTLWNHPLTQMNVVPPPTTISVVAATLAAHFNENSIWDHYGISAARSEVIAIGMLADLVGLDKATVGGIFTFGGTGGNLYAARIGIEKVNPGSINKGITQDIDFFCSDIAHYSIKTVASWTGIGSNNVKAVISNDDNQMKLKALRKALDQTIKAKRKIGAIFATMGTTDAFGIDPLKKISKIRDEYEQKVGYKIHIHADAVIGWPYLTFKGDKNIKHLQTHLQNELKLIVKKISELKYADSIGFDFHKTGWTPYLCSTFIVKDKRDFHLLKKLKKDTPYLYQDESYQPGIFTLESSRPNYAQKALVNMLLLGKEGYETMIIHLLDIVDYFRFKLGRSKEIAILNRHNPAFVTDFRIYWKSKYNSEGESLFTKELHDQVDKEFTEKVNRYNQNIIHEIIRAAKEKGSSLLSYTDSYKKTEEGRNIVALKAYPMSPFLDKYHIDQLLKDIYQAKAVVDQQPEN